MNIRITKHVNQALFFVLIESTTRFEVGGVFISAKQPIPPYNIAIIVFMDTVLMMYTMHFRTLKKVTNPSRCFDARMIEKLTKRGA